MKLIFRASLIVLVVLYSCVEKLDKLPAETSRLVIYGEINDRSADISVRAYYTTGYNVPFDPITDAKISIIENDSIEISLTHDEYGFYRAYHRSGQAGNNYYLQVILTDSTIYKSEVETMQVNNLELDSIYIDQSLRAYDYFVDFIDNSTNLKYYRIRQIGYYLIAGEGPNISSKISGDPAETKQCFPEEVGYIQNAGFYTWFIDRDLEKLEVTDNRLFDQNQVNGFLVSGVENDSKFDFAYHCIVRMHAISKRSFTFWNAISNQLNNSGSIFETANFSIEGNIFEEGNLDNKVQGYFEVSTVSEISLFRSKLIGSQDKICKVK